MKNKELEKIVQEIFNQFDDLRYGYIEVDDYCDQFKPSHLPVLLQDENFPFYSRVKLCEFLDISESTLSGWIKEDGRMPISAKKAIALFVLQKEQTREINNLKKELQDKDQFLIVKDKNTYKVCRYMEEKDGTQIFEVVAADISELKDARLLSLPIKQQRLLQELSDEVIDDMLSRTENSIYESYLKEQQNKITKFYNYVNHPDKYYVNLDDVLGDLNLEESANGK